MREALVLKMCEDHNTWIASISRKSISVAVSLCMMILCTPMVKACSTQDPKTAKNISEIKNVTQQKGVGDFYALFDRNTTRAVTIQAGSFLTIEYNGGIGFAYLIFDAGFEPYSITDNRTGIQAYFGTEGYLHSFADLEVIFGYPPTSITISFDNGIVKLNELFLFTSGELPDYVQRWEAPVDAKTDMVLFSTHGDDEQLFFSGLLPTYAAERGYTVQVVYLTDHHNTNSVRRHEMLDGLWAVGVRNYPVFGSFGDYFCQTKNKHMISTDIWGMTRKSFLVSWLSSYAASGHW